MSSSFYNKHLFFNEQCFPRIYYFKTRLKGMFPRLQKILNFEFDHPERGVMRLRSDDEELKAILAETDREIEVGFLSTNTELVSEITESDIAIKPDACLQRKTSSQEQNREFSKGSLESNVNIIATTCKDLSATLRLLADVDWMKHAIVAVFADTSENLDASETARNKSLEIVTVRTSVVSTPEAKTEYKGALTVAQSSSSEQTFPQKGKAWPLSGPYFRPERSPATSPLSSMNASPQGSSASSLLSSSSLKTRTYHHPAYKTVSKKSNIDSGNQTEFEPTPRRRETLDSMETEELDTTQQTERNVCEVSPYQPAPDKKTNWDTDELRKAVSVQLEVQCVHVLERIITLLKSVKARRDTNAKVAAVTTLDKLIFEVEGLLSQSHTDSGIKTKNEIENQRLSKYLTQDLLKVHGVYGCGTFYNRLNIQIEVKEGDDRTVIQEEIKKVTTKYNYKDTDYTVSVVKSRPMEYGGYVICYI